MSMANTQMVNTCLRHYISKYPFPDPPILIPNPLSLIPNPLSLITNPLSLIQNTQPGLG